MLKHFGKSIKNPVSSVFVCEDEIQTTRTQVIRTVFPTGQKHAQVRVGVLIVRQGPFLRPIHSHETEKS